MGTGFNREQCDINELKMTRSHRPEALTSIRQLSPNAEALGQSFDFLSGGGEMGRLMRSMDWGATPLSDPGTWPQSLRTSVSTCLNCSFPILVWWGPELVKLYNEAYAPILGAKHPSALGARGRDVWPEIWEVISPMLDRVMTSGEASPADDLLLMLERHGYAEECYFSFSYSPIRDESGGIGGVFCPVIETTARVIGERRLRLQHRLAEQTSDHHTVAEVCLGAVNSFSEEDRRDFPFVALYRMDGDGNARRAACTGLGPGHRAFPEVLSLISLSENRWLRSEEAADGQGRLIPTQGMDELPCGPWDYPPTHLVVLPLGTAGTPAGFMVAGLNPCRPLEETRQLAGLLAGQLSTSISNALAAEAERRRADELAEIDRMKTAFFANISHEFRTPLTLLLGPLDNIIDGRKPELSSTMREELELARRNALRLQKLVNTLLDFSRIEAGRTQAIFVPTDLAELTSDLAAGFRSACARAGLRLVVDCPRLPKLVVVDRDMWEKIVLNLLSNAFKFTFEGEITVTLRQVGDKAELRIADTGVGIATAELPRIFERFHRIAGQRSRTYEGSGIGLALVQELVRLQGGVIAAASAEGQGTEFIVAVPWDKATTPSQHQNGGAAQSLGKDTAAHVESYVQEALSWLPDTPTEKINLEQEGLSPASRSRILVADDNADMRTYVSRLLGADWLVEAVADGDSALQAAKARRPDLVLVDVMMPGLDGLDFLRALRGTPELKDIPVILLSARAGEHARIEGLDAGADDYVSKPFSADELRARVRANLSLARLRREVTESLADSEERLRRLFEEAPAFMCVLRGPTHVFELANAAYNRLIGRRDVLGKPVREVLPDVEGQAFFDLLDEVYRSGKAFSARSMRLLIQPSADKPPIESFLDFIYQPIFASDGSVTGIFVEGSDVTAHVRAEEALRNLNEQLEARVAKEIEAKEAALTRLAQAQRMEALGQLAGGIAHDFNNVLQIVSGGLNLIQKRSSDPNAVQKIARMAYDASERGAAITGRLLAFARRGELIARRVEAEPLLESLHEMLVPTLGVTIAVKLAIASDPPALLADKAQLETVLINLAINSRDAMPDGGVLTIGWNRESVAAREQHTASLGAGHYVKIDLTDTGVGMDEATLKRASEPFFTTKPAGQGTGLGLAMARGFAEQSGGGFAIASAPGRGTSVTLWFPEATADMESALKQDTAPVAPRSSARALVVDDDPIVREILSLQLQGLGYVVSQASDGLDALDKIDTGDLPELLVTDYSMPGMNGLVLIEEARRRQPHLPALLLTGYADAAVRLKLEESQDNSILLLRKPVTEEELVRQATALLRGAS